MAWISQMKVAESRTIFTENRGNGKAEREMTVSFTPGELLTTDSESIRKYCREMSELCKCSIDEAIGTTSEPREPQKGGAPDKKDNEEKATEKQVKFIKSLAGKRLPDLLKEYEVENLEDLTTEQASGAIELLKEKK
jgi:hypothetical protein